MTIVAYRAGILAADRLVSSAADIRLGRARKVRRVPGGRVALLGSVEQAEAIVAWLLEGRPGAMPQGTGETRGRVIFVPDRGQLRELADGLDTPLPRAPYYAWGSGSEIALGAMYMGASAKGAVRAAIALCVSCGGPVDTL